MDLINTAAAAKMLYDGMVKDRTDFSPIPFYPQKTFLNETKATNPFPRATPARVGMDGGLLLRTVKELSGALCSGIHSCLVITDGKCLFDASAPGYDAGEPHAVFSMCKTVTGLAIGMLIDDGRLSLTDKVCRFFPEHAPGPLQARTRSLTVEHLLSMTSGVTFAEVGAAVETNFVKSYFESVIRFEPGSTFAYNSMNSYILSAIVCRVTGKSLSDFLTERLWGPLGIEDAFWEVCPKGVEKGGWGLYLSPYSMAKLGLLFLEGGLYHGKRIVSEKWIEQMTRPHALVPDEVGNFHYGYHLWVHKKDGSYLFNGMLGQNVWVSPALKTVVVLTSGETTMFQDGKTLNIFLRAYVGKTRTEPPPAPIGIGRALRKEEKRFGRASGWLSPEADKTEKRAAGAFPLAAFLTRLSVAENNSGLLPLITRLCQGNHSKGIRAIRIKQKEKDVLRITFTEGEEQYTFAAGHHAFLPDVIRINGEPYRTTAAYAFAEDENRLPILKVELHFPELASTRRLIFRRVGNDLTLSMSEMPGFDFVEKLLSQNENLTNSDRPIVNFIKERLNFRYLMIKAAEHFSPKLVLEAKKPRLPKAKEEKKKK